MSNKLPLCYKFVSSKVLIVKSEETTALEQIYEA